MAHVVVVEDEHEIQTLIIGALREEGHTVEAFADGREALDRLTGAGMTQPDLIVLDLMLPNVDGLAITREVRRTRITPILMLTAKSTELDRVLGLELGADDYLTKPFSIRELQARVGAILRRVEMMRVQSRVADDTERVIADGDLTIDPTRREVLVNGTPVSLTAREFDLLYLLASNAGRAFSRDYLLDRLWRDDFEGFDRTVDTHILRLRRKLGGAGTAAERIVTLWGVGYKYERLAASERTTP
jgi:DNA-binding response OmpR family regulator